MNTTANVDPPADSIEPANNLRRRWGVVTTLLVGGIFIQAVFAGAMLSGEDWARTAHSVTAVLLIVATIASGLISLVGLRRIPHGVKLGLTLLSLAAAVILQTVVGKLTSQGANLLWVHIPVGVALVGFAGQAAARARRLGEKSTQPALAPHRA